MIEEIYNKCRRITEEVDEQYSLMVVLVVAGKPITALESIIVATYQTPEEGAAGLHSMVENVKPEDLLTQPREEEITEPRPGAPVEEPEHRRGVPGSPVDVEPESEPEPEPEPKPGVDVAVKPKVRPDRAGDKELR